MSSFFEETKRDLEELKKAEQSMGKDNPLFKQMSEGVMERIRIRVHDLLSARGLTRDEMITLNAVLVAGALGNSPDEFFTTLLHYDEFITGVEEAIQKEKQGGYVQ